MPDTSSASEAGAGAEALLGLAAGHQIRLPSVNTLSDATKTDTPPLHPGSQHPFLPSPPPVLKLSEHSRSAAQLPHLAAPTTHLPPPASERLPTISEWPDPAFRTLPPPPPPPLHPLPPSDQLSDRWKGASNHRSPCSFALSQSQWPTQTRPHHYQPSTQAYYYYNTAQPQSLPAPYNLAAPISQPVNPLRRPLVLPVPRSESNTSLPPASPIEPLPALDRLRVTAAPKNNTSVATSLPSLGAPCAPADISIPAVATGSHMHPPQAPEMDNHNSTATLASSRPRIPSRPNTPPTRRRGIADLINPVDTSPSTSNNLPPVVSEPVVKPSVESPKPIIGSPNVNEHCSDPLLVTCAQDPQYESPGIEQGSSKSNTSTIHESRPEVDKDLCFNLSNNLAPDSPKCDADTSSESKEDQKSQKSTDPRDMSAVKNDYAREPSISPSKESEDDEESEETRCPCGKNVNSGTMIACDGCNTWQHIKCMGFRRRAEAPEEYYCHICRPDEMRLTCIAHPLFKERNGRDRDGRDSKRDVDLIFVNVKPLELRKVFASDLKRRKGLNKTGRDFLVHKYASLLKSQYPKNRHSIIDGLTVLLDSSRLDISEKLDSALRKLRYSSSEKIENADCKGRAESSSEGCLVETNSLSISLNRSATKRQRPHSLSLEHANTLSKSDLLSHLESSGVEVNGAGSNRGMSREDRKLLAEMRLFRRMEERERERKRPKVGDVGQSPKAGHFSRQTPRGSSNLLSSSSKPGTPIRRDSDENKGHSSSERKANLTDDSPDAESNGSSSQASKGVYSVDVDLEKVPRSENGKYSQHEMDRVLNSDIELLNESRRERSKMDRSLSRRKESIDNSFQRNPGQGSILDRIRSHDSKRRRALLKDGKHMNDTKRDSSLDIVVHVTGPSVLGSRIIPKVRLSALMLEDMAEISEFFSKRSQQIKFALLRKDETIRAEHAKWQEKLADICPIKKRHRLTSGGSPERSADTSARETSYETNPSPLSVSMVVVSEKDHLPDKGQILESSRLHSTIQGNHESYKKPAEFCFKKRMILGIKNSKESKYVASDIGKISPVSPNNVTPHHTGPNVDLPSGRKERDLSGTSVASSPKLRSSPVPSPARNILRSVPAMPPKRVRSPVLDTRIPASEARMSPRNGKSQSVGGAAKFTNTADAVSINKERSPTGIVDEVKSGSLPSRGGSEQSNDFKLKASDSSNGCGALGAVRNDTKKTLKDTLHASEVSNMKAGDNPAEESLSRLKRSECVNDGFKRSLTIPLSKPVAACNGLPSERNIATMKVKKNGHTASGLGLRSIRSVPAPLASSHSPLPSKSRDGWQSGKESESGRKINGINSGSNDLRSSDSRNISDILQQRLEGFLNPGNSAPDSDRWAPTTPSGDRKISGANASCAANKPHNSGQDKKAYRLSPSTEYSNGLVRSATAPAAFRGPSFDTKGPWGSGVLPSFASCKRPHTPFTSGRLGSTHLAPSSASLSSGPMNRSNDGECRPSGRVVENSVSHGLGLGSGQTSKSWMNSGHRTDYTGPLQSCDGDSGEAKLSHSNQNSHDDTKFNTRWRRHE